MTSTMKTSTKFTAFEDNGGGIALFIIDDDGNAIAGFGNFEYTRGSLAEAIADIDDYRSFGGDYGHDIEMPMHFTVDDDGFDIPDRELTIDELYRCWADEDTNTMIAWSDGDGVSYCEIDRMGAGARFALDIKEDDND